MDELFGRPVITPAKTTNDDQGTHILDNVYSSPANLLAQVLDIEHSSVTETEFGKSLLVCGNNRRGFIPVRGILSTFEGRDSDSLPLE